MVIRHVVALRTGDLRTGQKGRYSIETNGGAMPEMLHHRQDEQGTLQVTASGRWIIEEAQALDQQLRAIGDHSVKTARFDLTNVSELDTVGAWLLVSVRERLHAAGAKAQFIGLQHQHEALLNHIARFRDKDQNTTGRDKKDPREKDPDEKDRDETEPTATTKDRVAAPIAAIGAKITSAAAEARDLVAFIGLTLARSSSMIHRGHRLSLGAVLFQLQQVWLKALPMVVLSLFIIGLTTTYVGADEFARLGARNIAVQAIIFAILLEIGVLLPAILVAGRSASAFAGEIGAMKAGEEINSMLVVGLDPMVTLVIPRMVALLIALPLLGIAGQITGLIGCFLMAWAQLGLSLGEFMERVRSATGINVFLIGLLKTPFFGLIIAFVGCFQGMKVSGAAIEVGERATRAVVETLVLVILFDAFYSVALWVVLQGP